MAGYISDRWHVTNCIALSTIGSAVSVFVIWGCSGAATGGLALLYLFCALFGLFAGSYVCNA